MRDFDHVEIDVGGRGKSASVKELRNGEFPSIDSENAEDKDALRKSEERFRDIVELAGDWIWETGPDLRFTYLSGQCEQATGMKAEVFLGKTRQELIANDPNDSSLRRHLEDLEARRPFRDFDYTFVSASGKRLCFRINGKPVFDAAGRFQGYRGSGVNITERKRAEEALHTREAQLRVHPESS